MQGLRVEVGAFLLDKAQPRKKKSVFRNGSTNWIMPKPRLNSYLRTYALKAPSYHNLIQCGLCLFFSNLQLIPLALSLDN